jgi:hypothetical protein
MNRCRSRRTLSIGLLIPIAQNRGSAYTSRSIRYHHYGLEASKVNIKSKLQRQCFSSTNLETESNSTQHDKFDILLKKTHKVVNSLNAEAIGAGPPTLESITSIFEQWAELSCEYGLPAAETSLSLLRALEQSTENHKHMNYLSPDTAIYNNVLQAFASFHKVNPESSLTGAEMATEILNDMISKCHEKSKSGGHAAFPTTRTFNIVVNESRGNLFSNGKLVTDM